MELKTYQKDVLKKISSYMKCLNDSTGIFSAWKNIGMNRISQLV